MLKKACRFLPAIKQIRLSGEDIPLLQPVPHTFPELHFHRQGLLLYPCRLINENTAFPLWEKTEKRNGILIKIPDIAFQIGHLGEFHNLFSQFLYLGFYPVRFFRQKRGPKLFFEFLCFLFNPAQSLFLLLFRQHHLRSRINIHLIQLFHTALAEKVKASDGFHFLSPQLNTVRIFFREIKDINNSAPDGKLSRRIHLVILLIPHFSKLPGQLPLIQAAVRINMNHRSGYLLQKDLRRHQRSKGCDYRLGLSLYNFSERLHTFRHKLVAMDIRLIENKILRRIPGHFPVIKLIILKDLPGLQITESNDDFISKTIAESIGHMKLLGIHAACKSDTGSRFFQERLPFFKFRQFP